MFLRGSVLLTIISCFWQLFVVVENRIFFAYYIFIIFSGNPGVVQQKFAMKFLTGIDMGPARPPQPTIKSEYLKEVENDLKELKIQNYHVWD